MVAEMKEKEKITLLKKKKQYFVSMKAF